MQPNADNIVTRRAQLMSELARLRAVHGSPKILENVEQLLTRWWSPANWQAREDLLKTATWFLQLEQNGSAEKISLPPCAVGKLKR